MALLAANLIVGRLDSIPGFHRLLTPNPTLIIKDGKFIEKSMRREGVTEDEAMMAMREHGVDKVADVKLAVLESDGSISIVGKDAKVNKTRRKVRYVRHSS